MQSLETATAEQRELGHDLGEVMDRMMALLLRGVRREISRTGMSVLATLRDRGPSRITELAERERVTQPSMTSLVTRLEESGLARREADPHDGRAVRVSITEEGRALQRRLQAARAQVLTERLDALSDAEREQIAAALPLLDRLVGDGPPSTSP